MDENSSSAAAADERRTEPPAAGVGSGSGARNNVVVKVGMVGDAQVGKTSLMVKYVEGKFDEDYIHTLGAFVRSCDFSLRLQQVRQPHLSSVVVM